VSPIARPMAIIFAVKAGKTSFVMACAAGSRVHECYRCLLTAEITPTMAFLDDMVRLVRVSAYKKFRVR